MVVYDIFKFYGILFCSCFFFSSIILLYHLQSSQNKLWCCRISRNNGSIITQDTIHQWGGYLWLMRIYFLHFLSLFWTRNLIIGLFFFVLFFFLLLFGRIFFLFHQEINKFFIFCCQFFLSDFWIILKISFVCSGFFWQRVKVIYVEDIKGWFLIQSRF